MRSEERGLREIVRDHHHRLLQPRKGVPQILLQVEARHRVKRTEGLVEEEHVRVEHQGPHQAHALRLPARELARESPQGVARKARDRRQLFDAGGDLGGVPLEPARHQGDVAPDVQMRKEGAPLDDISDLPPDLL